MKIEVVYGPPGTGKSKNLIDHVSAFLTRNRFKTAMMCSHTKVAAITIKERWAGKFSNTRLQASTLHSYCFAQLRLNRGQVVDDDKLNGFLNDFGLSMEPGDEGVRYMEFINYAAAMDRNPMDIYDSAKHPGTRSHFGSVYESYGAWKESLGYTDFNDMLKRYVQLNLAPQFHMLAIDESQDLSVLHWRVIDNMLSAKRGAIEEVLVTGDDDQSLFSYAGVDANGMRNFQERWKAESRVLAQSYRVPIDPFNMAQGIITRVQNRVPKEYRPTAHKGEIISGVDFWHMHDLLTKDKDTLILYADKFKREQIETILKEEELPYEAFSGMPAPLQTAGGKSLVVAATLDESLGDEILEPYYVTIRRGLSSRGGEIWDRVGRAEVIKRLRDRDMNMVRIHWSNEEYLRRVSYTTKANLRISTIHGAKGAEAEHVHLMTGVSPAAIEYSNIDPDALHRLFYVAVTRTKDKLFVYDDENAYDL